MTRAQFEIRIDGTPRTYREALKFRPSGLGSGIGRVRHRNQWRGPTFCRWLSSAWC
jgi:hypothetical protein